MKEKIRKVISSKIFILTFILILLFTCIILFYLLIEKDEKVVKTNPYDIELSSMDNFVFLGDSITDYYPIDELYDGMPVVNSGIAGYTTEDILNNLDNMVTIYNPTKVFILIGTNDMERDKSND